MKVISIVNMKGGVGKTTLAVNLADCLSRREEQRVLVIDVDPQFNATQALISGDNYVKLLNSGANTVVDVFSDAPIVSASTVRGQSAKEPLELSDIKPTTLRDRLDILLGNLELYRIEMTGGSGRENRLKRFLEVNADKYDVVIIDTPPTPSVWMSSALIASEYFLVPVKPEPLSVTGIDLLRSVVGIVVKNYALSLKCGGLILTMTEPQTLVYRGAVKYIDDNDYWSKYRFTYEIPKRTCVARLTGDQAFMLDSTDQVLKQSIVRVSRELLNRV